MGRWDETWTLLRLAWPVVLGQLGWMAMGLVDTVMVGHLGVGPLAAVAVGNSLSFGVVVVAQGTVSGFDPLMAQAFGAGRPRDAGRAALRGALLLLLLAVPILAVHVAAPAVLQLLGQPPVVVEDGGAYVRVVGLSVLPLLWFLLVRQLMQARGLMWPATVVVVAANLVNLLGNWLLLEGRWGLPALGAEGCAWATVVARTVMLVGLHLLVVGPLRESWPGLAGVIDLGRLRRLATVSLPVGLQLAAEVWAFVFTAFMMGWLGELAVASHAVAVNLAAVSFMVPLGISAAAATRVGNLLGAGEAWSRAAWSAVGLGVAVMSLSALLFLTFPMSLAGLFSDEDAVVLGAAALLPLAAAFQLFDGAQVVLFGVLRGAGDTRMPLVVNLIGWWSLGIPAGAVLAFGLGLGTRGLWVGLVIGLASVAVLLTLRLRSTIRRGGYRVVE